MPLFLLHRCCVTAALGVHLLLSVRCAVSGVRHLPATCSLQPTIRLPLSRAVSYVTAHRSTDPLPPPPPAAGLQAPRSPHTPTLPGSMSHMIAHKFAKTFKVSTCDFCNKQMIYGTERSYDTVSCVFVYRPSVWQLAFCSVLCLSGCCCHRCACTLHTYIEISLFAGLTITVFLINYLSYFLIHVAS